MKNFSWEIALIVSLIVGFIGGFEVAVFTFFAILATELLAF